MSTTPNNILVLTKILDSMDYGKDENIFTAFTVTHTSPAMCYPPKTYTYSTPYFKGCTISDQKQIMMALLALLPACEFRWIGTNQATHGLIISKSGRSSSYPSVCMKSARSVEVEEVKPSSKFSFGF